MKDRIEQVLMRTLKLTALPENPSQKNVEAWDSLRHLSLVIELEAEFDVEFEPEEIAMMKSVEEIEAIIKGKNN